MKSSSEFNELIEKGNVELILILVQEKGMSPMSLFIDGVCDKAVWKQHTYISISDRCIILYEVNTEFVETTSCVSL